jgi:hypothetical protein
MLRMLAQFLFEIQITKMSNSYDFSNLIWADWDTCNFKMRLNNRMLRTASKEASDLNSLYKFLTKDFKNKKLPL